MKIGWSSVSQCQLALSSIGSVDLLDTSGALDSGGMYSTLMISLPVGSIKLTSSYSSSWYHCSSSSQRR